MNAPIVRRAAATDADLALVAPLFDAYRQYYGQPGDLALAREFLGARLGAGESVVFLALAPDGAALGFTQLYPSFSSVSAAPLWVLNDLFVAPAARGLGVGGRLLDAARAHARATGARRVVLETTPENLGAQRLYERVGYRRVDGYVHYSLELGEPRGPGGAPPGADVG